MSDIVSRFFATTYLSPIHRDIERMKDRFYMDHRARWQGPRLPDPLPHERELDDLHEFMASAPPTPPAPEVRVVKPEIANSKSCVGCKFLYGKGDGYSNYTWMDTWIRCALDRNPNLAGHDVDKPSDWLRSDDHLDYRLERDDQWKMDNVPDNWPSTNASRCDAYQPGVYVELDVEGDVYPGDKTEDWDQAVAIAKHAKVPPTEAVMIAVRALTGLERWEWKDQDNVDY